MKIGNEEFSYTGKWYNGRANGLGISKDANGLYEGYMKNNIWEGKGKVTYNDGSLVRRIL